MVAAPIHTGIRFFGQEVLIGGSGDAEIDAALKRLFYDDYVGSGPLEVRRADVQRVLRWKDKTSPTTSEGRHAKK